MVGVLERRSTTVMLPSIPLATYRLQLNASFGFDQAAAIIPHLRGLGISHLYASPFLRARAGSTHGYDIVDYNALNPELGGEPAFDRLTEALAQAGIGLILDFVPNHMAVHFSDNAWWLDLLEWGPRSPHAASFDIDWNAQLRRRRGRLLLPILGQSYGDALVHGEIQLRYNAIEGSFSAWYHEHRCPIAPRDYARILRTAVTAADAGESPIGRRLFELAMDFQMQGELARDTAQRLRLALTTVEGGGDMIKRGLKAFQPTAPGTCEVANMHRLLERQHYRLAHWRLAATDLNYRRFFDINSLAGVRVEDAATFAAVHRLVGRLIECGDLQGLRIDHIDGFTIRRNTFSGCRISSAPSSRPTVLSTSSWKKFWAKASGCRNLQVLLERTGYEWLNLISRVLLDGRGLAELDRIWKKSAAMSAAFDEI